MFIGVYTLSFVEEYFMCWTQIHFLQVFLEYFNDRLYNLLI